jgi:hypothetical protein
MQTANNPTNLQEVGRFLANEEKRLSAVETELDRLCMRKDGRLAFEGWEFHMSHLAQEEVAEMNQPDRVSEPINRDLKNHVKRVEDWGLRETARWLHEWAERFNDVFDLRVETPAICIDRIHYTHLGSYRYGRNGFGLRREITLNESYLTVSKAELLDTLLHELLHEEQDMHGKPGKGNYHNKQFRTKALSFGLHVDTRGRTVSRLEGPFTALLEKHGIDVSDYLGRHVRFNVTGLSEGRGKMLKWSCGCTNIRAAVGIAVKCLKCGNVFKRACPSW